MPRITPETTSLQQQARALGDPTRYRVYRYLVEAPGPVGVAELTDHHGLSHNTIRQHLAKLVDAGLVTETTAPPAGPGRPRLLYAPSPTAESRWGPSSPYERLSRMLIEVIAGTRTPEEVGRDDGRRRALIPSEGAPAASRLLDVLAREGFEPELRDAPGGVELVLHRCPFESTAVADPGTICALHLGMVKGIAEHLAGVDVVHLVARDPRQHDCLLRVAIPTEERAPAGGRGPTAVERLDRRVQGVARQPGDPGAPVRNPCT